MIKRIIDLTIITLIFMFLHLNVLAASNFPIDHSFADGFEGYTIQSYADKTEVFGVVENNRLKLTWGGVQSNSSLNFYKSLDVPYTLGNLTVEYDMCLEQGYLYSLYGFPTIVDSDGNEYPLIKYTTNGEGRTYFANGGFVSSNALQNTKWDIGKIYKVKVTLNFNTNKFKYFVDSGNGYEQKSLADGTDEFSFGAKNIKKIGLRLTNSSSITKCVLSIGYMKIYSDDYEYIFVSPNGNNAQSGSFENPVQTISEAYNRANPDTRIYLKEGTYEFDGSFDFSHLDKNLNRIDKAFIPFPGDNVRVTGDFKMDIPDLNNLPIKEEYKNSFINSVKESYISAYYSSPLRLGNYEAFFNNENNSLSSSLPVANVGLTKADLVMIAAVYDKNNSLVKTKHTNYEINDGEKSTVSVDIDMPEDFGSEYYTVKLFVWNSLTGQMPVIESKIFKTVNITPTSQNETIKLSSLFKNEGILISGIGEQNKTISVRVQDPAGNIAYLNQAVIGQDGEYQMLCKMKKMYSGTYNVYYTVSDGGQ